MSTGSYSNIQNNIDIMFYCTALGVKCEVVVQDQNADLTDLTFHIETSDLEMGIQNPEYTTLVDDQKEAKVIFFNTFVKDSNNPPVFSTVKRETITQTALSNFDYTLMLEDAVTDSSIYPIKMDMSFYLYKTKQPDSSVKSSVRGNQYLSNHLFVGNSEQMGDMNAYIRFESNAFRNTDYTKIISAKYIAYELTGNNANSNNIAAYRVTGNWGSPSITWSEQPLVDSTPILPTIIDKFIFDVTFLVIEWNKFLNGVGSTQYNNRFGFVLKNINDTVDSYSIFASADNVVCCPKLVITYQP